MFVVVGKSSVGMRKSVNQDAWCALAAETSVGEVGLFAVCDGVGGLSAGELASSTVVSEFASWFERDLASRLARLTRTDDFERSIPEVLSRVERDWDALLQALNRRLSAYGTSHGVRLGTTFTGMLVFRNRYLLGHVGDCRAYHITATSCDQITNDQTVAARAVAEGSMTKREALSSREGSVLLQSVGTQTTLRPEFSSGLLRAGDLVVLCCDGFYRKLGDEGVRAAYATADARDEKALARIAEELMERNMSLGEKDNMTVVCFSPSAEEEGTAVLAEGGDDPTTVLDSPTTVLSQGVADDTTTLLADDEETSSLEGGDAPWRA